LSTEIIAALIGAAAVIIAAIISVIGLRRSSRKQSTDRTLPVHSTPAPATPSSSPTVESLYGTWDVTQTNNILHIAYGTGLAVYEYAALHLNSSYFRMNYGPPSGWGTSLILLPAFWSKTACSSSEGYCQGASVEVTWQIEKPDLVLSITGNIGGLSVSSLVDISPPTTHAIIARITTTVTGSIPLDMNRPGEAFKPIMLSSMRVSATEWDTRGAYTDEQSWPLPKKGWIIPPPVTATERPVNALHFGLKGGTSAWKTNAPTIDVLLDQAMQVTGWVTKSDNPNDDNVGLWAASDKILTSWSFTVTASS
jgi:hypothetical protein